MNVALPLNSLFSEKCNSLNWPCEHIAVSLYSEPQMKSIVVILSTFGLTTKGEEKRDLNSDGEKNKQHMLVLKSVEYVYKVLEGSFVAIVTDCGM